jgi:hypothetical protein
MATPASFDPSTLLKLRGVREVRIETTALDGSTSHRTIIWIVVVGDQPFVRSERGTAGRWYREALAQPDVTLHVDGTKVPVTAIIANDADSVQRVSGAFREKYGRRSPGSTEAMLQPHTLETTLRLLPGRA